MLYCTVTGQLLETSVEAVKRHMSGKKYIRNKGERWRVKVECDAARMRQQETGANEAACVAEHASRRFAKA